jgi:hypothetical protein
MVGRPAIAGLPRLLVNEAAEALSQALIDKRAVPQNAAEDALHIALATVHGMDFLLTWNCRHIANARIHHLVRAVCAAYGWEPPVICTPEGLKGD